MAGLEDLERNQAIPSPTDEKGETEYQVSEDGSVQVDFDIMPLEEEDFAYSEDEHYENLVEHIDDQILDELGMKVCETVQDDEASRSDWLSTIEFGLDLLGVKVEERDTPFEGACSAQHPLLMESAVKFQSKASNELLPADGPVKVKVLGDISTEKEEQANRVKNHMNYQITEQMTEFYPDSERLLLYTSLVGDGFKKTYYDAHLERPVSEFVPADQFVVPSSASDLHRSERYTHILYKTEYEFEADCAAGLYIKPDTMGKPKAPNLSDVKQKTNSLMGVEVGVSGNSDVYTLYEQHVECYIDGIDAYDTDTENKYKLASPYVITVDAGSQQVVGIRRNWKKGDKKRGKKVIFSHYSFVPGFGFYSFGFLHLLGNLQLSLTSSLRSLVDAGQFANLQGGFKLKGVRIVDDNSPVVPGQFKEIEAHVMDINKALMPLPFKGADQTLYSMLEFLDRKGQKFADSTEQIIQDSNNQGPVGTTLALLDASTKFFSAIHKRLHASLKNELKAIASLNSETLPSNLNYNIENKSMAVSRKDYSDLVDVVPVSDANVSSSAHRMAKAQTILQVAQQTPDLHDMREVLKHFYINMDYEDVDRILPMPEEATANDPMTDIQNATGGKPIKAFEGQDHKAHIALKQAFLQDPMSGANPMMQKASIAVQANVQEHLLLSFMEQVNAESQTTQAPLEQAASKVAQMNQQKLQQEQAEQQQSPRDQAALIMAQAEMLDTKTEAKKQEFDEKYKVAQLELNKEKIDLDMMKEMRRGVEFDKTQAAAWDTLVSTKGLDAMISGLSQKNAQKQKEQTAPKDVDKT